MKKLNFLLLFLVTASCGFAQNTGINTTTPQAYLDINGDMALRMGVINLPNAANADVNTTTNRKSVYRITNSSPLGASISGFTGGVDGRTITLINTSTSPLGIFPDLFTGNTSAPANRIITNDGSTLYIQPNAAATLLYDATVSRWRVSSFTKPDVVVPASLWYSDGNDLYNSNTGNVGIGANTAANSDQSKLFITTANNGVGLIHTNGTIKLGTILGDRIGSTPAQDGAWIGTRTNHPLMLMTNDVEAMKIKANGAVQIGYNANSQYTLKGHDWAMLDVFERPGGTGNTLAAFGKVNGLSIQSNPATIGFNEYNDPSTPSHTPKIMTTGNAARNSFDADYGRLDWETFNYANGSDIAAGTPQKIMSLSTAVAGVAGGGSQLESDRLTIYTNEQAYGGQKYGFVHKQGNTAIGTKIDPIANGTTTARFGTQTNNNLAFFTNDNAVNAMTISTSGNVGIGTNTPNAKVDITSTNSGLLIPRLTTAARSAINTPATGLLVYDSTLKQFYYHDGGGWQNILPGSSIPVGYWSGDNRVDDDYNFQSTYPMGNRIVQVISPVMGSGGGRGAYTSGGLNIFNPSVGLIQNYITFDGQNIQARHLDYTGSGSDEIEDNLLLNKFGGNVGIGTSNPTYKLSVNGNIRAKEIVVETGWADYVFDEHYKLPSLDSVELQIKENKHLPGIPSADNILKEGLSVGVIQAKMMEKIEELTLYIITQNKKIEAMQKKLQALENK